MKKFLLLIFSIPLIIGGSFFIYPKLFNRNKNIWVCKDGRWIKHGNPKQEKPSVGCEQQLLVGGDEDEHGCKPSAGYTWCEPKQKCLRTWEESCENIENTALYQLINFLKGSLSYPTDWEVEITDKKPQDCEQLDLYSHNYKLSDGYPILKRGAYIMVKVCETEETNIEDNFKNKILPKQLAENIENIKVSGVDAIQYDYSFEGWSATDTIFIKNSVYYTVKFRYVNKKGKAEFWDIYETLLNSF